MLWEGETLCGSGFLPLCGNGSPSHSCRSSLSVTLRVSSHSCKDMYSGDHQSSGGKNEPKTRRWVMTLLLLRHEHILSASAPRVSLLPPPRSRPTTSSGRPSHCRLSQLQARKKLRSEPLIRSTIIGREPSLFTDQSIISARSNQFQGCCPFPATHSLSCGSAVTLRT
jgi:hypothetical protein